MGHWFACLPEVIPGLTGPADLRHARSGTGSEISTLADSRRPSAALEWDGQGGQAVALETATIDLAD
jgi:hypothetical protein